MPNIICPECNHEFGVSFFANIPKSQTMTVQIEYEGEMLAPSTIAGILTNFSRLNKESAKSFDGNANVQVIGINTTGDSGKRMMSIEFFLSFKPNKSATAE